MVDASGGGLLLGRRVGHGGGDAVSESEDGRHGSPPSMDGPDHDDWIRSRSWWFF